MEVTLEEQAARARQASRQLAALSGGVKNDALRRAAARLRERSQEILAANAIDVEQGKSDGLTSSLLDRLTLTPQRVEAMARGLEDVAQLPDPIGTEKSWRRPNGLLIRRVQVPLGVLCLIYEARPNVTVESASLALKSGNACLLRGSRSALHSNRVLVECIRGAISECAVPADAVQGVADLRRESIDILAKMRGSIDCLIPRGGADLISRVVAAATVPVLETGVGNCHLYVDSTADFAMARELIINSKCSRPAVCNSLETVLVDRQIAAAFLADTAPRLRELGVSFRTCEESLALLEGAQLADESDWSEEFLDLRLGVKIVAGMDEALAHISRYSSGHTEAIVTTDLNAARRFQTEVDACTVNVNASTRFTDGGEFGFGAEIGISTQKFHARGPVGLQELTTCKYLVEGTGQIRV